MAAIKLQIKSRSGRDLLPDGLILPSTVSEQRVRAARRHFCSKPPIASPRSSPHVLAAHLQATVDDLKARFAELKPRYYPSRQRFTLPPREGQRSGEALAAGKRLVADYGLQDGSALIFKDLGPQVGRCAELPGSGMAGRQGRELSLHVARGGSSAPPPSPASPATPACLAHLSLSPSGISLCCRYPTPLCSFGSTLAPWWTTPSSTSCQTSATQAPSERGGGGGGGLGCAVGVLCAAGKRATCLQLLRLQQPRWCWVTEASTGSCQACLPRAQQFTCFTSPRPCLFPSPAFPSPCPACLPPSGCLRRALCRTWPSDTGASIM